MDLLKLIRSFEDLLFEVLSWLIYYPRTLWLIVSRPLETMAYVRHEEAKDGIDRYPDRLSPPLILLLTVALAHGAELASGVPHPLTNTQVGQMLLDNDQNLIVVRSLIMGLLPLIASLQVARAKGLPPERQYLRPPFLGQCYLTSILAFALAVASLTGRIGTPWADWAAGTGAALAAIWYGATQVRLFEATLGLSRSRAVLLMLRALGVALLYGVAAAFGIYWLLA